MNQKAIVVILGAIVIILFGTTIYFATISSVNQPKPTFSGKQQDNQNLPANNATNQTQSQSPAPATQVQNNTNSDISTWIDYSNAKYNFSLKYPPTLGYLENEHSKYLQSGEIIEGMPGHTVFDLSIMRKQDVSIAKNGAYEGGGINISVVKRETREPIADETAQNTTIGGQAGKKTGSSSGDSKNINYIVEYKGYVYTITAWGPDPYYFDILSQAVSTFKFIK